MPKTINLPTYKNNSGQLTVIEKKIKFKIKRVYFIHNIKNDRGGHKHKKNTQFILCLKGSCKLIIINKKLKLKKSYILNKSNKGIVLFPDDWHKMTEITKGTILLVLASEYYNKKDYINHE